MKNLQSTISAINWPGVSDEMNIKGQSIVPGLLSNGYRFGLGKYKYCNYSKLAPFANGWMRMMKTDKEFPDTFFERQTLYHTYNQTKPTVLILKYGKGGHNTLHQDLYGDIFFPIQLVLFLDEPGDDYTGGGFVLTQQTPRAQSNVIVLKPAKGDSCYLPPISGL